jgi:hypothetical protein
VDQLLAVQFQEDMTRLVQHCGRRADNGRQTVLVSATLTPKVPRRGLHPRPPCAGLAHDALDAHLGASWVCCPQLLKRCPAGERDKPAPCSTHT